MIYQHVVELNKLITEVVNDYLGRLGYVDEVVITPESWSECTETYPRFYVDMPKYIEEWKNNGDI